MLIFSSGGTLYLVLCVCLSFCVSTEFGLDLERFGDSSFLKNITGQLKKESTCFEKLEDPTQHLTFSVCL